MHQLFSIQRDVIQLQEMRTTVHTPRTTGLFANRMFAILALRRDVNTVFRAREVEHIRPAILGLGRLVSVPLALASVNGSAASRPARPPTSQWRPAHRCPLPGAEGPLVRIGGTLACRGGPLPLAQTGGPLAGKEGPLDGTGGPLAGTEEPLAGTGDPMTGTGCLF